MFEMGVRWPSRSARVGEGLVPTAHPLDVEPLGECAVSSPDAWPDHDVARDRVTVARIQGVADILRQVAKSDAHVDARRGDVSLALAGPVDACGMAYQRLPTDLILQELHAVVDAVDRATGRRHFTGT